MEDKQQKTTATVEESATSITITKSAATVVAYLNDEIRRMHVFKCVFIKPE